MTTEPHSPYDSEITEWERLAASANPHYEPRKRRDALHGLEAIRRQREGYLRAVSEAEALREAIRMLLDNAPGTPQYEFARKVAEEALEGRTA